MVCVWAGRCVCRVDCTIGTLALYLSIEATAPTQQLPSYRACRRHLCASRTVELVPMAVGAWCATGLQRWRMQPQRLQLGSVAWHGMAWAVHCMAQPRFNYRERGQYRLNHVIGGFCRVVVKEYLGPRSENQAEVRPGPIQVHPGYW